jgi:hypothetical protein
MACIRTHTLSILMATLAAILLAIFFETGHPLAGWPLLALAISLPLLIGVIEKRRNPEGHWWLPSILVTVAMPLIVFGLAIYAVSRI